MMTSHRHSISPAAIFTLDTRLAFRYDALMTEKDWQALFEKELNLGGVARAEGNEGKARVCARRAAGIIARQALLREGVQPQGSSALDVLEQMQEMTSMDEQTRTCAALFLLRVDDQKNLPDHVDLLAQARWLREHLFGR